MKKGFKQYSKFIFLIRKESLLQKAFNFLFLREAYLIIQAESNISTERQLSRMTDNDQKNPALDGQKIKRNGKRNPSIELLSLKQRSSLADLNLENKNENLNSKWK